MDTHESASKVRDTNMTTRVCYSTKLKKDPNDFRSGRHTSNQRSAASITVANFQSNRTSQSLMYNPLPETNADFCMTGVKERMTTTQEFSDMRSNYSKRKAIETVLQASNHTEKRTANSSLQQGTVLPYQLSPLAFQQKPQEVVCEPKTSSGI